MESRDARELLLEGRANYLSLLDQARDLLRNLDTLGPSGLEQALLRRQELLDRLGECHLNLQESAGRGEGQAEYQAFREETTRKIMEVDALVIALARDKQAAIKEKLTARSRSKSASDLYGSPRGARKPLWLNDKV